MIDNIRGLLLGLAVGDAVGTTNEFSFYNKMITHASSVEHPIVDMIGGGPFNLEPGEWTDDTSMALCLADSLIEKDGFDPIDQLEKYNKWRYEGYNSVTGKCFDIGSTTSAALLDFTIYGRPYSPNTSRQSAGNGSLMRLAPVIIYYSYDAEKVVHYAGLSSATTHAAPQAVDACRFFARLVQNVLQNACNKDIQLSKDELLNVKMDDLNLDSEVYDAANIDYRLLTISDINPSGYVVDSLKTALFCFTHTDNFKDGCLMATNMGGDADTNAAIFGQLAGAYYGMRGIPIDWLDKLAWREKIRTTADDLYKLRTMWEGK